MNELIPILDKLANAGIVFVAIILVLFIIVFGIVLAIILNIFKHIREEENVMRKRRL